MKIYQLLITAVLFILGFSCANEETMSVKADFKMSVVKDDYSVPVKVEIENLSTGADRYEWIFEGATVEQSTDINPKTVYYNTPGIYIITLKVSNKDGSTDQKSMEIQIDAAMKADFDWQMQGTDIAPLTLQMQNKSLGATSYQWEFEGGSPSASTEENPQVTFTQGGDYKIKLTITNQRETYSQEKTIHVTPAMTVDFDWAVDFIDHDYQAPVTLHINNASTGCVSYEWTLTNAPDNIISTDQKPDITIQNPGTYTLQLKATNDKESKVKQKQVTVYPDKNLLSFSDVRLGINTAHATIGCFFSSQLGKVLTKSEITKENGSKIDFAFFGMNASFGYNQFVSPDKVQQTAFTAIPNAGHTQIINRQELTGEQLTPTGFDAIGQGSDLSSVNITESSKGLTPFDNTQSGRIILFQTSDSRKGAIKITGYVTAGNESYILADVKIQKKS